MKEFLKQIITSLDKKDIRDASIPFQAALGWFAKKIKCIDKELPLYIREEVWTIVVVFFLVVFFPTIGLPLATVVFLIFFLKFIAPIIKNHIVKSEKTKTTIKAETKNKEQEVEKGPVVTILITYIIANLLLNFLFPISENWSISLTWDFFIMIFFVVLIAYSFIVGLSKNLKILIASYISIFAADGFSEILKESFFSEDPIIPIFKVAIDESSFIILKISMFVFFMIILSILCNYTVNIKLKPAGFAAGVSTFVFGFLNSALITSTILRYASGASFIECTGEYVNSAIFAIYRQSNLVKIFLDNYSFWLSLPVFIFILLSLFVTSEKQE